MCCTCLESYLSEEIINLFGVKGVEVKEENTLYPPKCLVNLPQNGLVFLWMGFVLVEMVLCYIRSLSLCPSLFLCLKFLFISIFCYLFIYLLNLFIFFTIVMYVFFNLVFFLLISSSSLELVRFFAVNVLLFIHALSCFLFPMVIYKLFKSFILYWC